jgi:hypothetical protein
MLTLFSSFSWCFHQCLRYSRHFRANFINAYAILVISMAVFINAYAILDIFVLLSSIPAVLQAPTPSRFSIVTPSVVETPSALTTTTST